MSHLCKFCHCVCTSNLVFRRFIMFVWRERKKIVTKKMSFHLNRRKIFIIFIWTETPFNCYEHSFDLHDQIHKHLSVNCRRRAFVAIEEEEKKPVAKERERERIKRYCNPHIQVPPSTWIVLVHFIHYIVIELSFFSCCHSNRLFAGL